MPFEITLAEGEARLVDVARRAGRATVSIDRRDYHGSLRPVGDGYELTLEDRAEPMWILVERDTVFVHAFGRAWSLAIVDPIERSRAGAPSDDVVLAPMPGTVMSVAAAAGDEVASGQQVLVIESMKMETEIVAMRDGTVQDVFVAVGDTFDRGVALFGLVPEPLEEED